MKNDNGKRSNFLRIEEGNKQVSKLERKKQRLKMLRQGK